MPFPRQYPYPAAAQDRVSMLAEIVEILVEELAAIASRNWHDLSLLKKKKVVLASRLRSVDWTPSPAEQEASDIRTLRHLVAELEGHVRRKIQEHMELLGMQVAVLQDQHQHWRECLNVSFRRFYDAIPAA